MISARSSCAVEPLDAAGQVDVGPDHGEVEPVAGADIAVADRAVMQRQSRRADGAAIRQFCGCARRARAAPARRVQRRAAGLGRAFASLSCWKIASTPSPMISSHLAAVLADRRHDAVEILVEHADHRARAEPVRQHREVAQIDQHHRGGDRAHVAAADLPVEDQLARLAADIGAEQVLDEPQQRSSTRRPRNRSAAGRPSGAAPRARTPAAAWSPRTAR